MLSFFGPRQFSLGFFSLRTRATAMMRHFFSYFRSRPPSPASSSANCSSETQLLLFACCLDLIPGGRLLNRTLFIHLFFFAKKDISFSGRRRFHLLLPDSLLPLPSSCLPSDDDLWLPCFQKNPL